MWVRERPEAGWGGPGGCSSPPLPAVRMLEALNAWAGLSARPAAALVPEELQEQEACRQSPFIPLEIKALPASSRALNPAQVAAVPSTVPVPLGIAASSPKHPQLGRAPSRPRSRR